MPVKVAVTDVYSATLQQRILDLAPPHWIVAQAFDPSEPTRLELFRDADVVLAGAAWSTDEMIRAATRLRLLQKLGAGYNNLNLDLCKAKAIAVATLPGNNAVAVAEHALMLMLAVYRHLADADRRLRAGDWYKEEARAVNRELRGKCVGIVGMGHIGRELARRLRAFDVTIVYYDARRLDHDAEDGLGVRYAPLDDLVTISDIVSIHVPLLAETTKLINRSRIRMMKSDAVLINCARGEVVDEPALVEALGEGHLYGAGLDCFEHESAGGTKAFWPMRNVVLTPHIAGADLDNFDTMISRAFSNAQAYLAGMPLPAEDVVWVPSSESQ